jgi:DNA-3-methyladenine glycosylase II
MPSYQVKWNAEEAISHLKGADPRLGLLIENVGALTLKPRVDHSIFESLLRSIVYQQLAGSAAAAILGRVKLLFSDNGYPSPQQIVDAPEELLRSAGLSRNKMAAIKDLSAKALDGTVPTLAKARYMSDEELVDRLVTIRGVGVWTVEMLLIFRMGRPDVLPVTDYGVRKGVALTYKMRELPTPKQLLRRGEKWRPYRSVASWYFWRAAEKGSGNL